MNFQEFILKYCFDYDEDAIIYIMEEYKIRLIAEYKELIVRKNKLRKYIETLKEEIYPGQRTYLLLQYNAMLAYSTMLECRAAQEDIKLEY